ncbi:Alanyl-tRNA synthetase [Paracholeplasma brassicae]|uniref:Alanine--tRNA ligase n=1 Tax=Acholeplasma brassicae TaxID=61635 RepID=U4KP00_9MOLU|nr:alanine--tRNA ligase [Paracholeplasma brassicae]CCV66055.1 Alanyl-tRNA synthetase [Paracholeplasma brassicae]
MKFMTSKEIRDTWLHFFRDKGHSIEPSSSLIPMGDKTLLWINAGVAPLKKYFDGSEVPPRPRLTNVQKCIRTNDIDNVGKTARHHTFFEMMGNFSIGDYFKEEAIDFGFELLTSPSYFGFPVEKLYMTYYPDDVVAKNRWLSLGVKEDHLIPLESNFWEIGEGPSGPDTEIYFDRGELFDKRGPELIQNDIENERYIEIWNIVFSQYNAKPGIPRNEYKELPNKNIDTGAGLERFACVIQGTKTNFETDLFLPIIEKTEELSGIKYDGQMAFKVIADHVKTLSMAIADGAILSNEGRGYVLRRLLRRALKYGKKINLNEAFLYRLVPEVVKIMGPFYDSVHKNQAIVEKVIHIEEMKFLETLSSGEKHLDEALEKTTDVLSKEDAFKLYDTFGFPIELTVELSEEKGYQVDIEGFKALLQLQKEQSRASRTKEGSMKQQEKAFIEFREPSVFIGYENYEVSTPVIKVFDSGIVLKETPFYATMGGQVADKGTINGYEVTDVIKLPNGQYLHVVDNPFDEGEMVIAKIDLANRVKIMQNHSATHLLHKALKVVLGDHVNQQGSQVTPATLRFDFNNYETLKKEEIIEIETIVKNKINEALDVVTTEMPIAEAKKLGAMALFGEKYGDVVRVVDIASYSVELCGGTHVKNTKEIIDFSITSFESIGSGIFRIEAVTGNQLIEKVEAYLHSLIKDNVTLEEKRERLVDELKDISPKTVIELSQKAPFIGSYQDVIELRNYNEKIKEDNKQLEKILQQSKQKDALSNLEQYVTSNDKNQVVHTKDVEMQVLKQLVDAIYDKMNLDVLFLINEANDKLTFMCKSKTISANQLIKAAAKLTGGSGGGRDQFAQGGSGNFDVTELMKHIKGMMN